MNDDDSKIRATPKAPAAKPGAVAIGGNDQGNSQPSESANTTRTMIDPPQSMSQAERDILAKQQAVASTLNDDDDTGEMKPGAVSVDGLATRTGAVPESAPSSRLAAKLRGEVPENWTTGTAAGPPVNSTLMNREEQIQSKIRGEEPPVSSTLMEREHQVQEKIRVADNTAPAAMSGALARLSMLEDSVTSKQQADQNLRPLTQSQQPEDMATAKSDQLKHKSSDEPPERLQQVEMLLDVKMSTNRPITGNETLEYGEYGGLNEGDLAVALAIDEEEGQDAFLPAAVEYDPDAKPSLYRSRRFRLYMCLALFAVVIGTIGAVLGILLTTDDDVVPLTLQFRETFGIRENIELFIAKEKLDDISSPYRKALDWITLNDPMALLPEDNQLTQRYIAAYLYFATSAKKPWSYGCSPPQDGESDSCSYFKIASGGGQYSTDAKRWLSNTNECEWAGIRCDKVFHIHEIDISTAALSGTFPEGLLLLPFIQIVRLAHSDLEGPLPDALPDLKHLLSIGLENNTFTGTFPDRWYESRSFQSIILSNNNITGTISTNIAKLKDIKIFALAANSLEKAIPKEIGDVPNMNELFLEQNLLTGTIPTQLGLVANLEELSLFRNKLTGTIPSELGLLTNLYDIFLNVNQLTGPIPEELWNPTVPLWRVHLSENQLNGTLSSALSLQISLGELLISDNQFSGTLPPNISPNSTRLEKIVATGNKLNGTVPSELCDQRRSIRGFNRFELDCLKPLDGGTPEISCPDECCTLCCASDGSNCVKV